MPRMNFSLAIAATRLAVGGTGRAVADGTDGRSCAAAGDPASSHQVTNVLVFLARGQASYVPTVRWESADFAGDAQDHLRPPAPRCSARHHRGRETAARVSAALSLA